MVGSLQVGHCHLKRKPPSAGVVCWKAKVCWALGKAIFGRKFMEMRERVGYELNFSSYPPFIAKIEYSSQVSLHVFLPIAH